MLFGEAAVLAYYYAFVCFCVGVVKVWVVLVLAVICLLNESLLDVDYCPALYCRTGTDSGALVCLAAKCWYMMPCGKSSSSPQLFECFFTSVEDDYDCLLCGGMPPDSCGAADSLGDVSFA